MCIRDSLYLTPEQFDAASKRIFTAVEGLYVEEDQPILKLIDNWQWFYHILLPLEPGRIAAARDPVSYTHLDVYKRQV